MTATRTQLEALRAQRVIPAAHPMPTPGGSIAREVSIQTRNAHEEAICDCERALSQAGARFEIHHALAQIRGQSTAAFNQVQGGPKQ